MTTIRLEKMEFYAFHGCFAEEATIGTFFEVEIAFESNTALAEISDSIEDTTNYLEVYQAVKKEMNINSHLLEHLVNRMGKALLAQFPSMEKIQIKVSKLNPPLGGKLAAVSVAKTMCR